MVNHNAGLELFPGACAKRLRTAGIQLQNRIRGCLTAAAARRACIFFLPVLAFFFASPKTLPAQVCRSYRVNTKESRIEIQLFRGGLLGAIGGNHVITLNDFSGNANFSPADGWKADLLGKAASLTVIDPWGNRAERKDVQDTMLGPTQLDVRHFPSIKLRSLSFNPTDQDTAWRLVAEVELHGVTRKEQFSLDCHQIGDKLQIRGNRMFKLTDFNIQPFSAALGAVKIKNDFEINYNIVLDRIQ